LLVWDLRARTRKAALVNGGEEPGHSLFGGVARYIVVVTHRSLAASGKGDHEDGENSAGQVPADSADYLSDAVQHSFKAFHGEGRAVIRLCGYATTVGLWMYNLWLFMTHLR